MNGVGAVRVLLVVLALLAATIVALWWSGDR